MREVAKTRIKVSDRNYEEEVYELSSFLFNAISQGEVEGDNEFEFDLKILPYTLPKGSGLKKVLTDIGEELTETAREYDKILDYYHIADNDDIFMTGEEELEEDSVDQAIKVVVTIKNGILHVFI